MFGKNLIREFRESLAFDCDVKKNYADKRKTSGELNSCNFPKDLSMIKTRREFFFCNLENPSLIFMVFMDYMKFLY